MRNSEVFWMSNKNRYWLGAGAHNPGLLLGGRTTPWGRVGSFIYHSATRPSLYKDGGCCCCEFCSLLGSTWCKTAQNVILGSLTLITTQSFEVLQLINGVNMKRLQIDQHDWFKRVQLFFCFTCTSNLVRWVRFTDVLRFVHDITIQALINNIVFKGMDKWT